MPLATTKCKSCPARVTWALTNRGSAIPVDAQPVEGGNIRLVRSDGALWAHVVGATIDMFADDDDGFRYQAHFVTCPDADQWRQR